MSTPETRQIVGEFWDDALRFYDRNKTYHWWDFPTIWQYINELVCGQRFIGRRAGLTYRLLRHCRDRNSGYAQGVSIGCGESHKELALLLNGVCGTMIGFDLSVEARARARRFAKDLGLSKRYDVEILDPIGVHLPPVDLVYWDMALHHMFDVYEALAWTRRILKPGGVLVLSDYIGPTRFQFSDDWQEPARKARLAMPDHWFRNSDGTQVLRGLNNFSLGYVTKDPSEAADSERIMAAMAAHFPEADLVLTGGLIYMHAMRGLWQNVVDARDAEWLRLVMELDRQQILQGRSCYVQGFAQLK